MKRLSVLILTLCFISRTSQAKIERTAIARAISCIGECYIVKGDQYHPVSFRSALEVGDEFLTRDGRAWLSMYGGAILRVSPHTQISALALSKSKSLLRLNKGHITQLALLDKPLDINAKPDSDSIFTDFIFGAINKDFYQGSKHGKLTQYDRLEKVFHENFSKKSKFLNFEYQWVTKFFQIKNQAKHMQIFSEEKTPIRLKLAGVNPSQIRFFNEVDINKTKWMNLNEGLWKLSYKSFEFEKENKDYFAFIDLLIESIPTIRLAQEVFFSRYSTAITNKNEKWLDQIYPSDYWNYNELRRIKLPFNRKFSKKYYESSIKALWTRLNKWHQRNDLHGRSVPQKHFHFIKKGAGRWHPMKK